MIALELKKPIENKLYALAVIGAKPHADWLPKAIETDEKGNIKTGLDAQGSFH